MGWTLFVLIVGKIINMNLSIGVLSQASWFWLVLDMYGCDNDLTYDCIESSLQIYIKLMSNH